MTEYPNKIANVEEFEELIYRPTSEVIEMFVNIDGAISCSQEFQER